MADESVVAAQGLANDVTIRHEMKGRVYRSSQGLQRFEGTQVAAGPGQPEPAAVVWVIDPVKHTALNWNTHLKIATLTHLPAGGGASFVLLAKPRVPGGELKLPPEDTTTTDLGHRSWDSLDLIRKDLWASASSPPSQWAKSAMSSPSK
jgi:hypothetical protein